MNEITEIKKDIFDLRLEILEIKAEMSKQREFQRSKEINRFDNNSRKLEYILTP